MSTTEDSIAASTSDIANHENSSISNMSESTPPTSIGEGAALDSLDETTHDAGKSAGRSMRQRKSINYNLQSLNDKMHGVGGSRTVSALTGDTLIDDDASNNLKKQYDSDQEQETYPADLPPRVVRRTSVKDKVKKVAGQLGSVLGKRHANVMEAVRPSKILKQLDMGSRGLLDEVDFDAIERQPAKQRKSVVKPVKTNAEPTPTTASAPAHGRKRKVWLTAGLYDGQPLDNDQPSKKVQKLNSEPPAQAETSARRSFMPLPMFGFLDADRDFVLPFDVYAPSYMKGDPKPKDWHQLNRNRLVGEAKELWEKEAPLARSLCICRPRAGEMGCDDDCLNRAMHYECDENNCALEPSQCSNRAFYSLAKRMKKGGAFDIGVEVVKTGNRGFGVRACRPFKAGDIIMEYTGEIISEDECQRRMRELYAGKHCYYIMEFDQGLHIDGTKGSMARFVNHSCEPNCEVRMVKVAGTPRMAIFAGERGVFTGEELTYDYNFDNFGEAKQACYCGAPSCRGHLNKRLNATEQKLKDKEDRERQLELQREAQKIAAAQAKKKEIKAGRGSGWRGWVTLGEVTEQLKQQKAARDEAEKNSSRAQRLAARRDGITPVANRADRQQKRAKIVKRQIAKQESEIVADDSVVLEDTLEIITQPVTVKRTVSATTSAGSKFVENLSASLIEQAEDLAEAAQELKASAKRARVDEVDDEQPAKKQETKSSRKGMNVLRNVERTVMHGLKQGKAKVMRQSTLSFGRL